MSDRCNYRLSWAECCEWAGHLVETTYGEHREVLVAIVTKNTEQLEHWVKISRWAVRKNVSRRRQLDGYDQLDVEYRARKYSLVLMLCRQALAAIREKRIA